MSERIWVVATVSLPGLHIGSRALIDPTDSYMANCLARGYLQRLPETRPEEPVAEETAGVNDESAAGAE